MTVVQDGTNRFEAIGRLGAGSYGVVLKCRDSVMDSVVAVKKMKEVPQSPVDLIRVLREAHILVQTPHHPNIVRCLDAYMSLTGRVYLVFEHVDKTLSRELLFRPQGLSTMSVKIIFWQLLNGAGFLHSRGIIHRDLKPANVLLAGNGVLKICDFGFACCIHNIDEDDNVLAITRWYRAPEVLAEGEYGPGVDVWALGCILAELCTGTALLPGDDRIDQLRLIAGLGVGGFSAKQLHTIDTDARLARFKHPEPGEVPTLRNRLPNASPDLLELVHACLCPDPLKRPTAEQLMGMAWLDGVDLLVPKEVLEFNASAEGSVGGQANERFQQSPQGLLRLKPLVVEDLAAFTFRPPARDLDEHVSQPHTPSQPVSSRPGGRFGALTPSPVYQPLMQQLRGENQLLQLQGNDFDDFLAESEYAASIAYDYDPSVSGRSTPVNSNSCHENALLMQLTVASGSNRGYNNEAPSPVTERGLPYTLPSPGGRHQSLAEFECVQQQLGDVGLGVVGRGLPYTLPSPGGRHQSLVEFECVQQQLGDVGLEVVGRVTISQCVRLTPELLTPPKDHEVPGWISPVYRNLLRNQHPPGEAPAGSSSPPWTPSEPLSRSVYYQHEVPENRSGSISVGNPGPVAGGRLLPLTPGGAGAGISSPVASPHTPCLPPPKSTTQPVSIPTRGNTAAAAAQPLDVRQSFQKVHILQTAATAAAAQPLVGSSRWQQQQHLQPQRSQPMDGKATSAWPINMDQVTGRSPSDELVGSLSEHLSPQLVGPPGFLLTQPAESLLHASPTTPRL